MTGGLSEYAAKVGRSKSRIAEYRQAAEVAEYCSVAGTVLDKTVHLSAIHALPRACWQEALP